MSTQLINPTDTKATIQITDDLRYFDKKVAENVPHMIRTLCSVWIVMIILSVAFISVPSEEEQEEPEPTQVRDDV